MQPGVAAAAPGSYLVAYRRPDLVWPFESGHVYVRAVTDAASGPPVAVSVSLTVAEDTAAGVVLQAADPEGDALVFRVTTPPAHGTLTGTPPALSYQPASNYFGPDAFAFVASDGYTDSAPAIVSVTVTPVNDAPTAVALAATVAEDGSVAVTLAGADVDGDGVSFRVASAPAHGTLSGTPPSLVYSPAPNFNGTDAFTYQASDGLLASSPAPVQITVVPVNDPPVANAQAVRVKQSSSVPILLTGSDVDANALSYAIASAPAHGTLTGTPPAVTYTPARKYLGPDAFAFTVNDGSATSSPATVSILVERKSTAASVRGHAVARLDGGVVRRPQVQR
jgi:hypothetical protein